MGKTIVIMVMVGSFVHSSPVQTSELANEDTQSPCTQEQLRGCAVYLGTAVTTCVGLGLVPNDPISACAFSACVVVQVQLWDANCVPCACEWIPPTDQGRNISATN